MLLSRICIPTNLGFIFFTSSNFDHYQPHERFTLYLLSTAGCLLAFEVLWFVVPGMPHEKQRIEKRNDFIVKNYIRSCSHQSITSQHVAEGTITKPSHKDFNIVFGNTNIHESNALKSVNERVKLLDLFNYVYKPQIAELDINEHSINNESNLMQRNLRMNSDQSLGFGSVNFEATELAGIDAIREAVRRSECSFSDDMPGIYCIFKPFANTINCGVCSLVF